VGKRFQASANSVNFALSVLTYFNVRCARVPKSPCYYLTSRPFTSKNMWANVVMPARILNFPLRRYFKSLTCGNVNAAGDDVEKRA